MLATNQNRMKQNMNTENNETPEPHVLILKLTDKLNLRRGEKIIPYLKS